MPGQPIASRLLSELQRQLNHELGAAHAYTALAVWCVDHNLKGFGRYFYKQSGEEREHAQKLMNHLLDRGAMPELRALDAPKARFKALLEVAKHAQAMEVANTAGIHQAYEASLKAKDYPAQVFLHWFITEQVEEENWCDEMVERVAGAQAAGGLSYLDRHIERYLTEDKAEGEAGGDAD
jgi:ferritin